MADIQMTARRVSFCARVLGGLIAAAAIGISIAPPVVADPSNCQDLDTATVCGQGNVIGGDDQSAGALNRPTPTLNRPTPTTSIAGIPGCTNPYGNYQNCQN